MVVPFRGFIFGILSDNPKKELQWSLWVEPNSHKGRRNFGLGA